MVWLHGGAFLFGRGDEDRTDGFELARRGDVIVVSVNHRLGLLGHLHLADVGGAVGSGNAGMLDLVAALEWIHDNIAAFGGNPESVTIFGVSGGANKACVLLAMPRARGLFHRAVIASGPALTLPSAAEGTTTAELVLDQLDVRPPDLDALQTLPIERLLEVQGRLRTILGGRDARALGPVVDGETVTGHPYDVLAKGDAAKVALIIGCTTHEATFTLGGEQAVRGLELDDVAVVARLQPRLGEKADALVAAYRAARPELSSTSLLLAIESDRWMRVPSVRLADTRVDAGVAPVFLYLFAWERDGFASHGLDTAFVFANATKDPDLADRPGVRELEDQMSGAWTAFACSGSPDHLGMPHWNAYDCSSRVTMVFDHQTRLVPDPFGAERHAWSGVRLRRVTAL